MTKKDYIAIATILNKYSDAEHMILLKLTGDQVMPFGFKHYVWLMGKI